MNEIKFYLKERTLRSGRRWMKGAAVAMATAMTGLLAVGGATAVDFETDAPHYDGRWTATIQGSEAGYRSARVTFSEYGGSWQDTTPAKQSKQRACAGKTYAITIQRSWTTQLEFMVWGSSTAPDCPDLRVQLKPVDERTLEGTIGAAGTLRLTRAPAPKRTR